MNFLFWLKRSGYLKPGIILNAERRRRGGSVELWKPRDLRFLSGNFQAGCMPFDSDGSTHGWKPENAECDKKYATPRPAPPLRSSALNSC
jgi:hypothetical protein